MGDLFTTENLAAFLTLTLLEIVLGIDNIVFISILVQKLHADVREKARRIGLFLAMFMRIALLLAISWVAGLTNALFTVFGHSVSGRDLILLGGGLFLIAKATFEIHDKLEGPGREKEGGGAGRSFGAVIAQIIVLDLVFSLDSVITAVGMAQSLVVMIAAVVVAVGVMLIFARAVGNFIERHPTLKMLALAFLILIGVVLVVEGAGGHVGKGYIYFAMAFSLGVELLNLRVAAKAKTRPVELRNRYDDDDDPFTGSAE